MSSSDGVLALGLLSSVAGQSGFQRRGLGVSKVVPLEWWARSLHPKITSGHLTPPSSCADPQPDRRSAAELSSLAGNEDVGVYGIGRDLPFTMSAWSEKIGLDFPLLSDATLVVAQASQTKWAAVAPVESVVGR